MSVHHLPGEVDWHQSGGLEKGDSLQRTASMNLAL